jgi:hypothetical protein
MISVGSYTATQVSADEHSLNPHQPSGQRPELNIIVLTCTQLQSVHFAELSTARNFCPQQKLQWDTACMLMPHRQQMLYYLPSKIRSSPGIMNEGKKAQAEAFS